MESCYVVPEKKWPKRYELGPSGNFKNFNVTLKLKVQSSHFYKERSHILVIFTTV